MTAAEQSNTSNGTVQTMKMIPYERTRIQYPRVQEARLPKKPETHVRSAGLFGLGLDAQDLAHERRLTEIYNLGVETAFAEGTAVALEVKGVKATSEGVRQMEDMAYALPAESVAGMLTGDLVGESATRCRVRRSRLMDNYDAEALNLLRRS